MLSGGAAAQILFPAGLPHCNSSSLAASKRKTLDFSVRMQVRLWCCGPDATKVPGRLLRSVTGLASWYTADHLSFTDPFEWP